MQTEISYPKSAPNPQEAFSERTLHLATARLMDWRQGPGVFGGLHLHPCWEETGVIGRRYQGQTTFILSMILRGFMEMADRAGGGEWAQVAHHIASQLFWLRRPAGGFIHADFQNEPAYVPGQSCPIHQMLPAWALIDYAAWESSDPSLRGRMADAMRDHFAWFQRFWWKRGNAGKKPLADPGWCGVTNQDMVAIAAYGRFGQVFGDWSWFERFGYPALGVYLSTDYFCGETGQFERGDRPDFVERPFYLALVDECLAAVAPFLADERVGQTLHSLRRGLFDAIVEDERHGWMLAWGGNLDRSTRAMRWDTSKAQVSCYPEILSILEKEADRTGAASDREKVAKLQHALAAWVFADGSIPASIGPGLPVLASVEASINVTFWRYLLSRHPATCDISSLPHLPVVERRCQDAVFHQMPDWWRLVSSQDGDWIGYKKCSWAIAPANEGLPNLPKYPGLRSAEIVEHVRLP